MSKRVMLHQIVSFGRAVAMAAFVSAVAVVLAGCGSLVAVSSELGTPKPACVSPGPISRPDVFNTPVMLVTTSSGLQYGDISVGCGAQPRHGQNVALEYTGWLQSGTIFDTSRTQGRRPLIFQVGLGQILAGVDEGVATMRVGGKRRLVIPPNLAFGATGRPPLIPPNATIVLELELVAVQ